MKGMSLFSNVGIGEYFFKESGIEIIAANELISNRAKFYKHIYPDSEVICGDITDKKIFNKLVNIYKERNCEFLLATPPCQGMSIAGKMDTHDIRNQLVKYVIEFVKKVEPKNIIIENVAGMLKFPITINSKSVLIKDYLLDSFKKMGYFVNFGVLDAADYETPQSRRRSIFLVSKYRLWEFPNKSSKITVLEAIGDLPSLESGQDSGIKYHKAKVHNDNHIKWMRNTPSGESAHKNRIHFPIKKDGSRIKGFSTTYKRIDWNKPSPTITMCNGAVSSQNNVHPGRINKDGTYSDARVLTILELMRLTGLPDNWNIPEWASENMIRNVLGESFPPKFSQKLLETMPRGYKNAKTTKNR
ncbi:DNA cytosine methyltransferase [Spiroplasma cantharicola]|uniref:DNA (cytosine-5-)-methyltransferase n=1 Tax=Spiroplasma cantharicola TaxID=362837 RepID=A0A0M5KCF8_9MOLU|nr:DNA cytosine methyltransferase [Spiroplasma cantharicola]ALD66606.1 DNA (cytosine-5)-methyltransferase 1 [Spiroplasma cantharicola]